MELTLEQLEERRASDMNRIATVLSAESWSRGWQRTVKDVIDPLELDHAIDISETKSVSATVRVNFNFSDNVTVHVNRDEGYTNDDLITALYDEDTWSDSFHESITQSVTRIASIDDIRIEDE